MILSSGVANKEKREERRRGGRIVVPAGVENGKLRTEGVGGGGLH